MNDIFNNLSFMVATNMPEDLKSTLFPKLEMVYPNALKTVDTEKEGRENSFPSVHYSFWFRYGRRVSFFFFFFGFPDIQKISGRWYSLSCGSFYFAKEWKASS